MNIKIKIKKLNTNMMMENTKKTYNNSPQPRPRTGSCGSSINPSGRTGPLPSSRR